MSKIVKKIRILGVPFQLEYWDKSLPVEVGDERNDEEGLVVQGRYYSTHHKILVRNDLEKYRKQIVLVHELLHAYDDLVKISDDGETLSDSECDRISLCVVNALKEGLLK